MSLDVHLEPSERNIKNCYHCNGTGKIDDTDDYYSSNITHNLNRMAEAAGIYEPLWRPEEIGITKASQLIEPLTKGLELLKANPQKFEAYNAPNGWGLYTHFVPWVEAYLKACIEHPDSNVRVSR